MNQIIDGSPHGGVAILIRNEFSYYQVPPLSTHTSEAVGISTSRHLDISTSTTAAPLHTTPLYLNTVSRFLSVDLQFYLMQHGALGSVVG